MSDTVDGSSAAGPTRTCIGCRRTGSPDEFHRLSAAPNGELRVGHKLGGRGAWLCGVECFEVAVKRGAIGRALRVSNPSQNVLDRVAADLSVN